MHPRSGETGWEMKWLSEIEERQHAESGWVSEDDTSTLNAIILEDVPALIATIRKLREALIWYGVASHYIENTEVRSDGSVYQGIPAADDMGEKARAALSRLEAGPLV